MITIGWWLEVAVSAPRLTRWGRRQRAVPAGFQAAEPPDRDGHGPDHQEQPGDREPRLVQVEVGHEVPEGAVQVQLAGDYAEDLHGPDQERGRDRQPGDDEVVVHLADRPGERPAV